MVSRCVDWISTAPSSLLSVTHLPTCSQLPKGFRPDIHGKPPIWKLKKTLYGLKRALKAFYDLFTAHLEEIGYSRSANDRCLFHRLFAKGRQIMFGIHVVDFTVAASDNSLIDDLCTALKLKYIIKYRILPERTVRRLGIKCRVVNIRV